jgi:superfamily II DNA or RNA helicase
MRFGKSFTAMQCALQSDCTKVLIVSAKADVKSEWKKTVEMPVCFKDYSFVCDEDFKQGHTISELLESKPRIAVFLTLQNLTGKCSDGTNIKTRLKQVFEEQFDLIIVDETHYGAWSNTYGRPIQDDEDKLTDYTNVLLNQALLLEGFKVENPNEFIEKMCKIMIEATK